MDAAELKRRTRNLRAVRILGYILCTLQIAGGTTLLILYQFILSKNPNAEKDAADTLALGQNALFSGILWFILWTFVHYNLKVILNFVKPISAHEAGRPERKLD